MNQSTAQRDYTFETPGPVKLYTELGKGHVDITFADTDTTTVVVAGPRADECRVEQRHEHVLVVGPKWRGFGDAELTFQVTAPTHSQLRTKTGSAAVRLAGISGAVRTESGSGDVDLDRVEGALSSTSGSGDVRVAEAGGDVRIKTGSGSCSLGTAARTVSATTGSGDVEVGRAAGTVYVKTGSGSLHVTESLGPDLSFKTGSGDLEAAEVHRGRVSLKGASGDVRLGIPVGVPVWTDINTVTGRIQSGLKSTGAPAKGQDHVELRLRTVSGDITLIGR